KTNISLTGFAVPTADLSIGTFKLTDVVDPTNPQDAATKAFVEAAIAIAPAVAAKENTANKSTDGTLVDNSDTDFPTEQAVKTYVDTNLATALSTGNTALLAEVSRATAAENANTTSIDAINELADGRIYVGDGSNNATEVVISGNATMTNAGVLTIVDGAVTSAKIFDGTISNVDVDPTAAIAGSKITPDFNAQNVVTTGTLAAGSTTITGSLNVSGTTTINTGVNSTALPTGRGIANQVLTTDGAGTAIWQAPAVRAMGKVDATGTAVKITPTVTSAYSVPGVYTVNLSALSLGGDYIIQLTPLNVGTTALTIQVTAQSAASFTVQISDSAGTPTDAAWFFTVTDF
ncbi:hypothetical protein MWU65_16065, partial [Cellulophaga sp. F20128]|uniref:hypothetical protein n=1 Tax=Cellulophaga sp. F20128 TaxID=2926413 RepID=UPI001FF28485